MFPLQLSDDDLIVDDPSIFQELANLEDLVLDHDPAPQPDYLTSTQDSEKKSRKSSSSSNQENKNIGVGTVNRGQKLQHREVEKQRRKEMAKLYASLRELLPLEYIRGKRAVSEHMNEGVKYIKDMQKDIEELSLRRDNLKKLYATAGSSSGSSSVPNCVTVTPCQNGVEILITSSGGSKEGEFPLSKVLGLLIMLNLNVVSCVSTKTKEQGYLHRILFEAAASDLTRIDLSELSNRLLNVINRGN